MLTALFSQFLVCQMLSVRLSLLPKWVSCSLMGTLGGTGPGPKPRLLPYQLPLAPGTDLCPDWWGGARVLQSLQPFLPLSVGPGGCSEEGGVLPHTGSPIPSPELPSGPFYFLSQSLLPGLSSYGLKSE